MNAVLSLLAAFLAVVLVGVGLTALHDVLERAWRGARLPASRRPPHCPRPGRGDPVVAWRHLH